ncbi:precorrin-6y C5,15-methyltransferase (decarboxylating) subunit CbiE [Aquimarina sp. 2201CG5-10]|uniref:precorrin-6y C5,15-methyltransferase (decarboxylating) subunit CbiE n=1 Tax=Aquimarina callyspongiae TaxID=3098150 RepID=UPI002AB3CA70|nr:precorrin-6y C5,15-methyltransferase (decarboxylating) subunit CbiE [Aquimarina sp. 2201CG5-10]MDY8136631.1 precorrin-6y C5,15-methyltransferase (decarboxylating) subunit CbiE [Aquimarina sp. 2201CG5-10]
MKIFHVIGIGNKTPDLTLEQKDIISSTRVFSGGKRHYEIVKDFLPKDYEWISIQSPMSRVFEAYDEIEEPIVVFASGNPLFYGFSNTLKNKYPKAKIITEPYFSSIQLLANATNTNTNHLQTVSVHGRGWEALDTALILQQELIGILTDTEKNPAIIAQRMLDYRYDNYEMYVGEDIEGIREQFYQLTLSEASKKEFHPLNCVILKKKFHRKIDFGIADSDFMGLPGRPNMITKMPIRLTTLHFLDILNSHTLWDIGFCTGSVSIEAKLKNPGIEVIAFEKRIECEAIMKENQKRFGVPGIEAIMGDFFEQDLTSCPKPDTVFIGGHGGRLEEFFLKIKPFLKLDTNIVINAVKENSIEMFKKGCSKIDYTIINTHKITLDNYNPITLLKAKRIKK